MYLNRAEWQWKDLPDHAIAVQSEKDIEWPLATGRTFVYLHSFSRRGAQHTRRVVSP